MHITLGIEHIVDSLTYLETRRGALKRALLPGAQRHTIIAHG